MASLQVAEDGALASIRVYAVVLATHKNGTVARISCSLTQVGEVMGAWRTAWRGPERASAMRIRSSRAAEAWLRREKL